MSRVAPPRVDWVERQLLAGTDMRAALDSLDALRARHVRGAHATWGIALGLDVSVDGDVATIEPGLAYDARGRELLLSRHAEVPVPATGGVVALRTGGDGRVPQAGLRIERPEALLLGLDVPLGAVSQGAAADPAPRRHARWLAPPRVAAGTVELAGVSVAGRAGAFSLTVDTSAAGFATVPVYVVTALLDGGSVRSNCLGPWLSISASRVGGFTLDVRYAAATAALVTAGAAPTALPFGLYWIGVEAAPRAAVLPAPDPDCPPLL